ncbi:hypothetical protein OVA13_02620 [Pseudoxanthomonas sp. SL93]|uniref:hypothetical protein n=1 Tax=Pseudoxanthomonas sp. SL93 TaxID=2995142 RepID=UPI0022701C0F|nr:hypothetical protein [Pseudoxanthomonas sp. SL93]WAC63703.1 hypothetical protein OVA13_02620 [Pseudoxanthomonas sp. SL93]
MIIISQESSTHSSGSHTEALDNFIAWRPDGAGKLILAIGNPSQWHSSAPLPAGSVVTDLVLASSEDPKLASELWGPFLSYVSFKASPSFLAQLRAKLLGIPVRISISNPSVRAAVSDAISNCAPYNFKLHAG